MERFLSKRLLRDLVREVGLKKGIGARFWGPDGKSRELRVDRLGELEAARRARTLAVHTSVMRGGAAVYEVVPGLIGGVVPLESDRVLHGGLILGEVLEKGERGEEAVRWLKTIGWTEEAIRRVPDVEKADWQERVERAEKWLQRRTGWRCPLLEENRRRDLRFRQMVEGGVLKEGESERLLLSFLKAGDRENARRVLNERLAAMYLTAPPLSVLRARAVELMGVLARAAMEDDPSREGLLERHHERMGDLIRSRDFEGVSRVLTQALDDYVEGLSGEGWRRGHPRVNRALDFIARRYGDAISLRDVAKAAGISPFRLARLVRVYTGRTVLEHIVRARIRRAQELLEETSKSGAEIAYECGFGDQTALIRHFRTVCGTTPGRWRRERWAR